MAHRGPRRRIGGRPFGTRPVAPAHSLAGRAIGADPDDLLEGSLDEIVTSYGAFGDHQVLVCGPGAMVQTTVQRLTESGTPIENIRFDPY